MADRLAQFEAQERLSLAGSLNLTALDLHLQAKVDLNAARVGSFELLLRATDDTGPVSPGDVIARMRRQGLALEFTRALADRAVIIARTLHTKHMRVPVALNLDEPEMEDPEITAAVLDAFSKAPSVRAIDVEITETDRSTCTIATARIAKSLAAFAERGFMVWMDDASLSPDDLRRLAVFPIHGIKIDRSLLKDEETAKRALRHIRYQAEQYGISEIVAEGIEDANQLAWCMDHCIPIGQGFRFHRPASLDATLSQFA